MQHMRKYNQLFLFAGLMVLTMSFMFRREPVKVYLIGDSTVADYALEENYMEKRYPIMGWGQVFQQFLSKDSLKNLNRLITGDSALVVDKAKGGRSTRSFFEEGRWKEILLTLKKNDLVLIQFGHN